MKTQNYLMLCDGKAVRDASHGTGQEGLYGRRAAHGICGVKYWLP